MKFRMKVSCRALSVQKIQLPVTKIVGDIGFERKFSPLLPSKLNGVNVLYSFTLSVIAVDCCASVAQLRPRNARNPDTVNVDFKRCLSENAIYRCRR